MHRKRILCLLLLASMLLCGCGRQPVTAAELRAASAGLPVIGLFSKGKGGKDETQDENFVPYQAPPYHSSLFHEGAAQGNEQVKLDLSSIADGYIAISVKSEKRLKFQVLKDDQTYNYDLASDGTPSVFPLQCGDGNYRFRVMENVAESKYAEIYSAEAAVKLNDEFQPFLRPSDYVNYNENSACVKKAAELAAKTGDALGVVSKVYEYVCSQVKYDRQKAATVQSGYLPDPDETMSSGKGICFDYASLAAAMLRSQGIPTKEVFGYVSPDGLYHAWNMFYTEQTGWVSVSFEVSQNDWNRMDLTFSANGADASFIGDGSNYKDMYFY